MGSTFKLSDQQYKIMKILWMKGEASARQIQEELSGELAHTTVGTMLSRLEKKDILSSRIQGRERFYKHLVSETDVNKSMVSSLVSTLFKGDPSALVAHLVKESEIDKDELDSIRDLIEGSIQND